jgi:hypothetical protein
MLPAFLDDMSWEMAEVYGAVTDQIMINLAHYFPFYDANDPLPSSAFEYQASMLAQMGKVNADTMRIIRNGLADADPALKKTLEQAVISSVRKAEPELLKGVEKGILKPAGMPIVAPGQMRAFSLYYQQAAEKLNLVNTVMLESTQSAYQQAVSDVVADMELSERMYHTQLALDTAAGETVTGVSSWNQSLRHAMDKLKNRGITGFVDHAGRHWSAEAYVAMDIRTTVANTARSAAWETNQNFGNDLYSVSSHNGARPLCYPWQNKVISSTDTVRKVQDLDGNEILVVAQSETSYGEPAGLFGINCKHMADPFIPGVSVLTGHPQDEEDNEKTYEESQEQRRLERKIREQKRDVLMAKAQGADDEEIRKLREKAGQTSEEIDEFCKKTGRARHRDREGVYTKREFPDKEKYDVTQFENEQKKRIEEYYRNGGAQQGYTFGQMTPKQPITPNVASQATQQKTPVVQSQPGIQVQKSVLEERLEKQHIERRPFGRYAQQPTSEEIIRKIAGADKTKGSCASVGLAYAGNRCGYDVRDFRGGMSQFAFSSLNNLKEVAKLDGVKSFSISGKNDFTNAHGLLKNVEPGKEYFFTCGKHAAIVRKSETGYDYLEMQSGYRKNTWYALTDSELKRRFKAQKAHTVAGMKYEMQEVMIDIDTLQGNQQFANILEFINTEEGKEVKGIGGGEK